MPGLPEAAARQGARRRWSTCASSARSWSRTRSTAGTNSRLSRRGLARRETRSRQRRSPKDGEAVGVADRRRAARGFPTPSRKLEFYSRTLKDWKWPEYAMPGYISSHVDWHEFDMAQRRDSAVADFSPADPDPHPLRQLPSGSTKSLSATRCGSIPRTPTGWAWPTGDLVQVQYRDRLFRRQRLGDRRNPARASSPARITWAAGAGDRTPGASDGASAGRLTQPGAGQMADAPGAGPVRSRAPIPIPSASGGTRAACIKT